MRRQSKPQPQEAALLLLVMVVLEEALLWRRLVATVHWHGRL